MSQNPQDNLPYPLRLPNYRFLHQGRYHPYPTYNRQQGAVTHEYDNTEIAVTPTSQTNEAEPSTQQRPALKPQSQPVTDEQAEADLTNPAVIVDEQQGATSESSAPRDSVDLASTEAKERRA
ncbi:hypothetical protein BC827DRAFT_1263113 [Russula dissimulans]|nr:hypothetical protein BC827DRAFT_1263113 [Russula dissimulans]